MASVYRRGVVFYARVKVGGRWISRRIDAQRKGQALALAEDLQQRCDAGGALPPPGASAAGPTVAVLCERFVREYDRPRLKDVLRYRQLAERHLRTLVLPELGALPAAALGVHQVEQLVLHLRAQGKAERTTRVAVARLSAVLSWAQKVGLLALPAGNPCARVERGALVPVEDFWSAAEVRQLLAQGAAAGPRALQTLVMAAVALFEGLRLGELRALCWDAVDLRQKTLEVRWSWREGQRPKSGKARLLPLHPYLVPLLEALPRKGPLLFPVQTGAAAKEGARSSVAALRRLCARCGVRLLRPRPWHGLRHTFATHLDRATSGNVAVVSALLGHARQGAQATLGYLHSAGPDYLAQELAKLTYSD